MTNQITPDELRQAEAGTSPPLVIDVRSREEYAAGHIPGAENLPADELERWIGRIPKDKPIVVY